MTLNEIWRLFRWWLIYLGPRRDVTVNTFNGLLTVDSKQWLIGKYLYVKRGHEEHEINSAIELLVAEGYVDGSAVSGRTVLNVGANIGMTSIGLVRSGFCDRAIAFEPAPENYRLLVRNVGQNGLDNRIRHFQVALSSVDAELDLELSDDNSGDHRIRQIEGPGFFREEERTATKVLAKTLDNILTEDPSLGTERIGLIWVDIQGHEGHFFQGARNFLARGVPVISEFWPYGIERSGISRRQFCKILGETFSYFYLVGDRDYRKIPIGQIDSLFDVYRGPREFGLLALVSESRER